MADFDRLEQALAMSLVNYLGISFTQAVEAVRKQAVAADVCGWALFPKEVATRPIGSASEDGSQGT